MKVTAAWLTIAIALVTTSPARVETKILIGHFPNIAHTQALVAYALSSQAKGWFEGRLGTKIDWFVYNAGLSATAAIFAKVKGFSELNDGRPRWKNKP